MLEKCFKLENGFRVFDYGQCIRYLNHLGKIRYGPKFKLDKRDSRTIFRMLCYIIRDEENCKRMNIDLKKGMLIIGPIGCGKTSLMTLLKEFMFKQDRFPIKSTRDVATAFHKDGFQIIDKYGFQHSVLCLDDLGVEQNLKYYGNECNTIGEILLHRYEMLINFGIVTHATTNLNAAELENLYGNRVRSRLRAMFNLISFPQESCDKRK